MHNSLGLDIELAKSLRNQGLSFKKIGKVIGCQAANVRKILIKAGSHTPVAQFRYDIKIIKQLIDKGFNSRQVGDHFGVSGRAIRETVAWRTIRGQIPPNIRTTDNVEFPC
jgi:hypothetical protein